MNRTCKKWRPWAGWERRWCGCPLLSPQSPSVLSTPFQACPGAGFAALLLLAQQWAMDQTPSPSRCLYSLPGNFLIDFHCDSACFGCLLPFLAEPWNWAQRDIFSLLPPSSPVPAAWKRPRKWFYRSWEFLRVSLSLFLWRQLWEWKRLFSCENKPGP